MRMSGRRWLAALLLVGACGPGRIPFRAVGPAPEAALQPCPAPRADTTQWVRTASRRLPFTVLLPRELQNRGPVEEGVGEGWSDGAGLQVSYLYFQRAEDAGPPAEPARSGELHCLVRVGTAVAEVRAFVGEGTIVPGEYVTAMWHGADGDLIAMRAISRRPGRRDEMLAIMQSVRFAP